jgi:LuxR family quorum-sensing system transcriptional regulator CciR
MILQETDRDLPMLVLLAKGVCAMVDRYNFKSMIERFSHVSDEGQLCAHLEQCAADLGFPHFALGHHVDLAGPPQDAIRLTNYDPAWIERAVAGRFFEHDPVHWASTCTAMGFRWSDLPSMIRLTGRHKEILEAAATYGLGDGYTVPVHVPGEYRGTCSFGAASLERLRPNALPIANMIGSYAFEAARRIMKLRRTLPEMRDDLPALTERQRDSLILVARGKADSEIGALLGISSATAHEHVENVRRAYGNAQRPLLIARALFDGQISFSEIFGR